MGIGNHLLSENIYFNNPDECTLCVLFNVIIIFLNFLLDLFCITFCLTYFFCRIYLHICFYKLKKIKQGA